MNLMTLMMFNKVKQSIVNKLIIIKKLDYRLSINTKVNLDSLESNMKLNELNKKKMRAFSQKQTLTFVTQQANEVLTT